MAGAGLMGVLAAAPAEAQVLGYGVAGPAGLSGFFRTSAANGHVAGGIEALAGGRVGGQGEFGAFGWLRPRVGLRIDFRDHVRPDSRGTVQYWTFRAGVSFR